MDLQIVETFKIAIKYFFYLKKNERKIGDGRVNNDIKYIALNTKIQIRRSDL